MGTEWANRRVVRILILSAILGLAGACEDCEGDPLSVVPLPSDQIDVFTQKQSANVDILWVVDNSGSMAAEQSKIADRFSDFFRQLIVSQVDYQMGVITTDPADNGVLRDHSGPAVAGCDGCNFITTATPCDNPDVDLSNLDDGQIAAELVNSCPAQLVFRDLIRAGTSGDPFEEGFVQAALALGGGEVDPGTGFPTGVIPAANDGFLREDASLYLVFVSDEDEGDKQDGSPIKYYQRLFESLKGAGNEGLVSVSAITGWPLDDPSLPTLEEVCGVLEKQFQDPLTNDAEVQAVRETMGRFNDKVCEDQTDPEANDSDAEAGGRYIELACRTGGVVTNICEADYSTALDRLGANAAGLLRKFVISKADKADNGPDCQFFTDDDKLIDCDNDGSRSGELDGPFCVTARPIDSEAGDEALVAKDPVDGWIWEGPTNSIRFNGSYVPAPGAEVSVRYLLRTQGDNSVSLIARVSFLTCLLAAFLCAGCGGTTVADGTLCATDDDCGDNFACEAATGRCLCERDAACDALEFCNSEGACQARVGCSSNKDCSTPENPTSICDAKTGDCVTLTADIQCTLDGHCPYGSFCSENSCLPGCKDNGDCFLDQPCLRGACDSRGNACNDSYYCEWGETCSQEIETCVPHPESNTLCQFCERGDFNACNGKPGQCLVDNTIDPTPCTVDDDCSAQGPGVICELLTCLNDVDCPNGETCTLDFGGWACESGTCGRHFCGSSDCDEETYPCPKGYDCHTLVRTSGVACTATGGECPSGSGCLIGGETAERGFCSCVADADCQSLSEPNLVCANPGPSGLCVIGRTCGPAPGLTCERLQ